MWWVDSARIQSAWSVRLWEVSNKSYIPIGMNTIRLFFSFFAFINIINQQEKRNCCFRVPSVFQNMQMVCDQPCRCDVPVIPKQQ